MIVIVLVLILAAMGIGAYRFSRTFERRQRLVFWLVVALVAAYFVPRMVRAGIAGYRAGTELRQQQAR